MPSEACLSTNLKLEDGGSEIVPVDGRRRHQRHLLVITGAVQEIPTGLGNGTKKYSFLIRRFGSVRLSQ